MLPPDASSGYHLSLLKRDSSGTSPFSTAAVGVGSSPVGGGNGREGSTSPSVTGGDNNGTTNASRKGFAGLIPNPMGRSGSSSSELVAGVVGVGTSNGKPPSESKIQSLFAKYKDPEDAEAILSEGVESICLDLELKPEEFKVLVLAWKCGAERMCRFTKGEFVRGCRALRADSLKGLKARLPEAAAELRNDAAAFKDLYRFTFRFGLEGGQKALPVDMACSLWLLVFSLDEPPLLARWVRFLQDPQRQPAIRGIPRDTWNMLLNLVEVVGSGDLTSYDDSEAWPSLFDDFVEHENDAANQNVVVVNKKEEEVESGGGGGCKRGSNAS